VVGRVGGYVVPVVLGPRRVGVCLHHCLWDLEDASVCYTILRIVVRSIEFRIGQLCGRDLGLLVCQAS
jgi:hypothetical protein